MNRFKTRAERSAFAPQTQKSSNEQKQDEYARIRGILLGCLEDFEKLKLDEPELAEKLGFTGYVQFSQLQLLDDEHYLVLGAIEDKVEALAKDTQKVKSLLDNDVLPMLDVLDKR